MIPPSYLFKDIYRQHWLEPDLSPVATARNRAYLAGLTGPLTAAITAILGHPRQPAAPQSCAPACD